MKPPKPLRKIEEFRETRKSKSSHGPHGGGEGWAISYADMLMVLLSFFVMFFSLKEESPEEFKNDLTTISMAMNGHPEYKESKDGHRPASLDDPKAPDIGKNFSALEQVLKIPGVTVINEKNQLIVVLDDASFGPGQYALKNQLLKQVDEIVGKIKPYQAQIQIQVIGHADSRPLRPRGEFLQDNFDLSSIRALRVMKHMMEKGFPENHATARAASSFDRNARSVSFVIQQHADSASVQHPDKAPASVPAEQKAEAKGL